MTNAQKYEEIFGFPPDKAMCPAEKCAICPMMKKTESCESENWWSAEYVEPEAKDE